MAGGGWSPLQRWRPWAKARRAIEKGDAGTAVRGKRQMERGGLWVWVQRGLDGQPNPSTLPVPGTFTGHGCHWGICVLSCTGTQESLLVWSGNRMPQVPPQPGALQN